MNGCPDCAGHQYAADRARSFQARLACEGNSLHARLSAHEPDDPSGVLAAWRDAVAAAHRHQEQVEEAKWQTAAERGEW